MSQATETSSLEMDFKEKLREIVRSNGISETISEVVVKDAGPQEVGFTCFTKHVTIKFANPQVHSLHLFVKIRKENFSHEEMLDEMKAFETEATFLGAYVAAAEKMCKSKGIEGFIDFYPKCYHGDAKMIVLENLVYKGYEILDDKSLPDLQISKLGVETLAKHHAIAHVMIQETEGTEKFFETFPNLDHECYDYDKPNIVSTMEPLFDNDINSHIKILERSKIQGALNVAKTLKTFMGKPMGIIIETLKKQDEDSLLVLCHGDYRNNNMLFLRDKETNQIRKHIVIDLQLTRYNSPAIDLGYFFFTSVATKIRQNHLHELLQVYTDTFNKVTQAFGHPTNLTLGKLLQEYRKKIEFGFWMGLSVAVGPGMAEIMSKGNISEVDIKDSSAETFGKMVDKWIDEHPSKAEQIAEEVVLRFKEYEELTLLDTRR